MGIKDENKQDLINYRIAKAYEVYQEAIDNASMSHWTLAVNRLYYSLFHIANALLLHNGIVAKSHKGVNVLFEKHFVLTGKLSREDGALFGSLCTMRNTGDYNDLFDWTEEDVTPLFLPTKDLLDKLQNLITSSQEAEAIDAI